MGPALNLPELLNFPGGETAEGLWPAKREEKQVL